MYQGSCLCRNVRYEVTGEMGDFGYCHCTSCRKASGSAHAANAPVARSNFRLISGSDIQFPEWAARSVLRQDGSRQP